MNSISYSLGRKTLILFETFLAVISTLLTYSFTESPIVTVLVGCCASLFILTSHINLHNLNIKFGIPDHWLLFPFLTHDEKTTTYKK